MKLDRINFSNVEVTMNVYEDEDYHEFIHNNLDFEPGFFLEKNVSTFKDLFEDKDTVSFNSPNFCFEISRTPVEKLSYNNYQYFTIIEINRKLYSLDIAEDE